MKATSPKARTDEVRLHSSTKITGGKTYAQHCVRWYEDGERKQRCFGQLPDAEKFRALILSERRKADWIPRGLRVVLQSLGTGQRLLIDRKGGCFLQSAGDEPKPLPFPASWAAFSDIMTNHDGNESGPGLQDYLDAVQVALAKGAK